MTLNDLERPSSLYFAFFSPNFTDFQADYITVVDDRPIMSVKYCLPFPVFYFAQTITHPAARFFCDSWASCSDLLWFQWDHVLHYLGPTLMWCLLTRVEMTYERHSVRLFTQRYLIHCCSRTILYERLVS